MKKSRIGLIGPGAVGLTLAGALREAGHDVLVAARTPFDQIELSTPDRRLSFPASCVSRPSDFGSLDLAILAVKAHQTESAGHWIRAAIASGAPLMIAQNGVDHVERISALFRAFGAAPPAADRLAPAVLYLPAHRTGAGRAHLTGRAAVTAPDNAASQAFAEAFAGSFVRIDLTDDWITSAWMKLLMNTSSGAVTVPLGAPIGVLADIGAYALARDLIAEAIPVGRAEGAKLSDDLPDRLISMMLKGAPDHFPSITQDQLSGSPTEWRVRNEVVVRLAERHGLPVPLNAAFTTLLRLLDPAGRG